MRCRVTITVSCLLVACALGPPGCRKADVNQGEECQVYEIGMSQCNLHEAWRAHMNADILEAVWKHGNLRVVFKDARNDTLKQQAHVEEFVSSGVDLIIICPKESQALTAPVARAMRAGIPVIVLDRALVGEEYTCFIGGDNKRIGRAAGQWIKKQLGGKGKVVELKGGMASSLGQQRHAGFREAIADSDIEVVFEADMGWDEARAREAMESALAMHEEIDAVYAHNDPAICGAVHAARAAGRRDEMLFVGIGGLPSEGRPYVAQGLIDATFGYPTCGAEAIDTALKILAGEDVPKKIVVPTRLYTRANVHHHGELIAQ